MIASENFTSLAVLDCMSSCANNKELSFMDLKSDVPSLTIVFLFCELVSYCKAMFVQLL